MTFSCAFHEAPQIEGSYAYLNTLQTAKQQRARKGKLERIDCNFSAPPESFSVSGASGIKSLSKSKNEEKEDYAHVTYLRASNSKMYVTNSVGVQLSFWKRNNNLLLVGNVLVKRTLIKRKCFHSVPSKELQSTSSITVQWGIGHLIREHSLRPRCTL